MAEQVGCDLGSGYGVSSLTNGMKFNNGLHRKVDVLIWLLQGTASRCGSAVSHPPSSQSRFKTNQFLPLAVYYYNQMNAIPGPLPNSNPNPNPNPTPTTALLPIETAISNCKGHSSLCKSFVTSGECVNAASRYDDNTMYSQYTSHWFNFEDQEGCTAIFECADGYPDGGISGADIKDYFADIYLSISAGGEGCGICGSVYLDNGCGFTYNECDYLTCKTCNGTVCTHP